MIVRSMLAHTIAILATMMLAALPAAADDQVTGFVIYGDGRLTGNVTTTDGKPLRDVAVHVVSKSGGEQIVRSNRAGAFSVVLNGKAGEASLVFVRDRPDARVSGQTGVSVDRGTLGEAIEIRETLPPVVMAKPRSSSAMIPAYSDAAIEQNVWTKAWLMLEVSETGSVLHVKFLKRPGFDLDPIAVREGFKLKFEPARDRANRPTRSLVLWAFEWPSYYWLVAHQRGPYRMPEDVVKVPCRGSGQPGAQYRDCARPDLKQSLSERWIAPAPPAETGRPANGTAGSPDES